MCALQRPTITSTRELILGVLSPIAGGAFAGWQIVTTSVTFPGVLLVAVFVAPWLVEPWARRWLDALPATPPPPTSAPPSPGPPSPPPSER